MRRLTGTDPDREAEVFARQPVLNSHGEHAYPVDIEEIFQAPNPVDLTPPIVPEAQWAGWVRPNPVEADPVQGSPQMAASDRLGYRTGFLARSARSYGMTGRMLVAPRALAHPNVGEVAVDGSRDRLFSGVQAQQTDWSPSTEDIARSFLGMRGVRGAQRTINDSLT